MATSTPLRTTRGGNFSLTSSRAAIDPHLDRIVAWLLDEAYWTAGRDRDVIVRSMDGSRCYGVENERGDLVAFARTVSDDATIVWLCDVFVDATVRGLGIGTAMVAAIVAEYQRDGVKRFLLGTRDAHEVYERAGFISLPHPERFMTIDERPPLLDR